MTKQNTKFDEIAKELTGIRTAEYESRFISLKKLRSDARAYGVVSLIAGGISQLPISAAEVSGISVPNWLNIASIVIWVICGITSVVFLSRATFKKNLAVSAVKNAEKLLQLHKENVSSHTQEMERLSAQVEYALYEARFADVGVEFMQSVLNMLDGYLTNMFEDSEPVKKTQRTLIETLRSFRDDLFDISSGDWTIAIYRIDENDKLLIQSEEDRLSSTADKEDLLDTTSWGKGQGLIGAAFNHGGQIFDDLKKYQDDPNNSHLFSDLDELTISNRRSLAILPIKLTQNQDVPTGVLLFSNSLPFSFSYNSAVANASDSKTDSFDISPEESYDRSGPIKFLANVLAVVDRMGSLRISKQRALEITGETGGD